MREPQSAAKAAVSPQFRPPETTAGIEEMLEDSLLPADVQPLRTGASSMQGGLLQARHVLMTGATGFIGRWLAKEILAQSEARLTCMVRPGKEAAIGRLHGVLRDTGLDSREIERRTQVVEGDLRQPGLGLPPAIRDALSGDVDAVCHCAAVVNWVLSYDALKTSSVDATVDLLRIAAPRAVPFHFVSSLAVGSSGPAPSMESAFDARAYLRGQYLGYGQAKTVAEILVREAGRRGLPVAIYRPSFIAGHSETGAFNQDDILARVVSGCVRMGTAPDLDWTLDCLPVDIAARQIVGCSDRGGIVHLAHPAPRHWRECVLWMRLYGYDVRLVPYQTWLRQLEEETGPSGDRFHPLRPLRSFFLQRPSGGRSLTLPEIMLERNRGTSHAGKEPPGHFCTVKLDAVLLQRYFDAFVDAAVLPPTPRPAAAVSTSALDVRFFERALGATITRAEPLGRLSDHSIVSELTSWRSGQSTGLHRYQLRIDDGPLRGDREVVVKVKPSDRITNEVGEALSRLCSERVGTEYARWSERVGFAAGHVRELALYRQDDERWRRYTPQTLGTLAATDEGIWAIVLESIGSARLRDSVEQPEQWTADAVASAVQGLAALQAIWFGREAELRAQPWIGYVPTSTGIADMGDFWSAIAAHAAPRFSAWTDPSTASIQRRLVESVGRWWPGLEALPRTLIHNDFNPRNICLRVDPDPRLIAYDWELACIGAPQHDLAELLCFVLPADAADRDIDMLVEQHRTALECETGTAIDRQAWRDGFRAAVYDLMLNRLPMYSLVHRVRRQSFLPRVVQTWRRLYERFPL